MTSLNEMARFDHVNAEYENCYRSNDTFLQSEVYEHTSMGEMLILSGMVFCADCGAKRYQVRGR